MSEDLHNIDKLFKNAIDQHEEEPSPGVWDAIDKNLDKKKFVLISKKYNKLKWVAAVLLLFCFGMAMYTLQTRTRNKELIKQNKTKNPSGGDDQAIKNHVPFTTPENMALKHDDTNNSNEKFLNDRRTGNNERSDNNNGNDKNQQLTDDKQNDQRNGIEKAKQKFHRENKIPGRSVSVIKTKLSIVVNAPDKQENNPVESSAKTSVTNGIKKDREDTEGNIIPGKEKYIADIPLIASPQQLSTEEQISTNLFNPANITVANSVANKNARVSKDKKSNINSLKPDLFMATIFYSPDLVSANIKNDHPSFREDDKNEIRKNEKTGRSSTYGLLIDYALSLKLKLQSGLTIFTRITDINAKTIYARPDDMGNIHYRFSCSSGYSYVPVKSGNNPAAGDSTKAISSKSTLQYISVPLVLKYSITKGKLSVTPGVGISSNFLSKGKIETEIATPTGNENSAMNDIQGLKSNYFNGLVSLGAEYKINKTFALSFIPTAKFGLSSINKNAPVKTALNSIGLAAGITIKL